MYRYLVILVFAFINFVKGQNLEIDYSASIHQELSEEMKKGMMKSGEYGREQIRMNEMPDPATYKMLISKQKSSFTFVEKISNDQDPNKPVITFAPAGFGTTYHDLDELIVMKNYQISNKKYFTLEPLEKWNWTITDEKKEIIGYEVIKATSESETESIVAWFTPEISISNGPANYWGLPGLILGVKVQHKDHPIVKEFYTVSIKKLNKSPKVIQPKGEKVSQAEIEQLFQTMNKVPKESGVDND